MTPIRICTFNVENLFSRFHFKRDMSPEGIQRLLLDGWLADDVRVKPAGDPHALLVAEALTAVNADIVALQEIESLETLKHFNRKYLGDLGYTYAMCIDGNDSRGIDVGVLSRKQITNIRSHQWDCRPDRTNEPIFGRDCLEIDILVADLTPLTLFINHFKSIAGDRERTMYRRKMQAERVVAIVKERFGEDPSGGSWIILGDLNDYAPSSGLDPLLSQLWLENIVNRLPAKDRWTHHYQPQDEVHTLDYILASLHIASQSVSSCPFIERRGLPRRIKSYTAARFLGVTETVKASDHCPLAWDCII